MTTTLKEARLTFNVPDAPLIKSIKVQGSSGSFESKITLNLKGSGEYILTSKGARALGSSLDASADICDVIDGTHGSDASNTPPGAIEIQQALLAGTLNIGSNGTAEPQPQPQPQPQRPLGAITKIRPFMSGCGGEMPQDPMRCAVCIGCTGICGYTVSLCRTRGFKIRAIRAIKMEQNLGLGEAKRAIESVIELIPPDKMVEARS